MKPFKVISTNKSDILFEGVYASFKDCLENAVEHKIDLSHADLTNKNLTNVNLDDAVLPFADFSSSNLTGANLSEAKLYAANFSYSSLYNTCFAYSDMKHCRFDYASFGGTDFTQCDISYSYFSGQSCFTENFMNVKEMKGCIFGTNDGKVLECSEPPFVVLGLKHSPIVISNKVEFNRDSETLAAYIGLRIGHCIINQKPK